MSSPSPTISSDNVPPRWARALDLVCLGLVGLALIVAAYGGFRERIGGIRLVVTDREQFHPGRTSAALLWAIRRLAGDSLVVRGPVWDDRFGRPLMREAIMRGEDPDVVVAGDSAAVQAWWRTVAQYTLYR